MISRPHCSAKRPTTIGGWTFVEMLVAISLSAVFMGAASLVFSAISTNSKRLTSLVEIEIGTARKRNFYDQSGSKVTAYTAPNYGRAASVQLFRDVMLDDIDAASGVFCLPRLLTNSIRPEFLRYTAGDDSSNESRPRLDSPETFRQFLSSIDPTSAAIFDSPIRNVPATDRPNTSIFVLGPETDNGFIRVNAVYEIDLVTTTSPSGTYAAVRRYKNDSLTHYYDVFFNAGSGSSFQPSFVTFERQARRATIEGTATDRFKIAAGNPFHFIWLPDPAINPYTVPAWTPSDPNTSPRSAYEHMSAKTSFLVVAPLFPSI